MLALFPLSCDLHISNELKLRAMVHILASYFKCIEGQGIILLVLVGLGHSPNIPYMLLLS